MSKNKTEWIYDELLCFLGSAFFQVPVTTFIEANCLIFDPSVEDSVEYKKIHGHYKKMVEALLDAFSKDSDLSHNDVIRALSNMNSKKDLREIFQGLFEQVLAMDDLKIFISMMTQKNIELQQQALLLIIKTTGGLPDSLTEGGSKSEPRPGAAQASDDEIMRKVLEQSKLEYDNEQKRKSSRAAKDDKTVQDVLALSSVEVSQLEREKVAEQEKLDSAMARLMTTREPMTMSLKEAPAIVPSVVIPAQKPTVKPAPQPVIAGSGAKQKSGPKSPKSPTISIDQTSVGAGLQPKARLPDISSSQAAANWLKSAQEEQHSDAHSSAVQKAAAAMAGMSAVELKKRQEYLRQQRDKLVAMKKKEREKQLLLAEQSNPDRPRSSNAARRTLEGTRSESDDKTISAEDQKKLDMRRAIANKLKAELMSDK